MKKIFVILALALSVALPSVSVAETQITSAMFMGDKGLSLEEQAIDAQKKFNNWLKTVKYRGAIISVSIGASAFEGTITPSQKLYTILVVYEAQK